MRSGGQGRFGIGRSLQQHDIGPESIERRHEAGGAAGAVVANAEEAEVGGHKSRFNKKLG